MYKLVKYFTALIAALMWLVFGFLLSIPEMCIGFTRFARKIINASINNSEISDEEKDKYNLSISSYNNGFIEIEKFIKYNSNGGNGSTNSSVNNQQKVTLENIKDFGRKVIVSIVFWGLLVFVIIMIFIVVS